MTQEIPKYLSPKGLEALLTGRPVKYHEDPNCTHALRRAKGGKTVRISEQEIVDHIKLCTPCSACCQAAKPADAKAVQVLPPKVYPFPSTITVWTCSDGHEFYGDKGQIEALWYELELTKQRLTNLKPQR